MKAMVLDRVVDLTSNAQPLRMAELPEPVPGPGQVRLRVTACGVCHTELDEIEGRTPPTIFPAVLGHQAVGVVEQWGDGVGGLRTGDRVGVGWIGSACMRCEPCRRGDENLCTDFRATGRDLTGGYAEKMVIDQHFAFPIPERFTDVQAAPLLCAGAIGYRSLRLTGLKEGQRLGLTGFGASGHLVLKLTRHLYPKSDIFVFARSKRERAFALELGAVWAGDTMERAPQPLHAIIDTTPVWTPAVEALANLAPGGRLVINAIRKEAVDQSVLLRLDYPSHLWMEKEIKSVANVARRDISEFLGLAARIPIAPEVQTYPLAEANRALTELKAGQIRGAKVLIL